MTRSSVRVTDRCGEWPTGARWATTTDNIDA